MCDARSSTLLNGLEARPSRVRSGGHKKQSMEKDEGLVRDKLKHFQTLRRKKQRREKLNAFDPSDADAVDAAAVVAIADAVVAAVPAPAPSAAATPPATAPAAAALMEDTDADWVLLSPPRRFRWFLLRPFPRS